jgi:hypothetical protein
MAALLRILPNMLTFALHADFRTDPAYFTPRVAGHINRLLDIQLILVRSIASTNSPFVYAIVSSWNSSPLTTVPDQYPGSA